MIGTDPATPRIAESNRLYILDDEAVLFSGTRQELHVLNAPAAFVWCSIEEGLPLPQIAEHYASVFGIDAAIATEHVDSVVASWRDTGYLYADRSPPSAPTDIVDCLARLLDRVRSATEYEDEIARLSGPQCPKPRRRAPA